jgi:uncharacterized protein (TIGR02145 family)
MKLYKFNLFISLTIIFGAISCNEDDADSIGCGSTTSIIDIDGNIYNVVEIGTQCWMRENLKTTRYQNGDTILKAVSSQAWVQAEHDTVGAYSTYNNSNVSDSLYGKLYNGVTVTNSHNVCPVGWHVPTDAEFSQLVDYLGGITIAGGKMKALRNWLTPNIGADNSSGFTALPGGLRNIVGDFNSIQDAAHFWTSTDSIVNLHSEQAWYYSLGSNGPWVTGHLSEKETGCSVRCIKD